MNLTNISGGVIGALNVGGVQTVESIDVAVGHLLQNKDTEEIAQAFKALTEAITDPQHQLTETERGNLLEQVELLSQQAGTSADNRRKGVIKPIFDSLANACAGLGGIAVAWQTWGPAISKFFGI